MWNLKNKATKHISQSRKGLTDTENKLVVTTGGRGKLGEGIKRHKLLGLK